jgi:hypothetical protein
MDTHQGTESDFDTLASMAAKVRASYVDIGEAEWAASPLNWIRQVPSSHKKGKVGESLVMEWARDSGLEVGPRRHRGHDCIIAGISVEVKLSLRWNSGNFTFLELRDFDYDVAALLGIAPSEVYLWIVPKPILLRYARSQQRGASGRGSKWVKFRVDRVPEWLRRWGGSFAEAQIALKEARRYGQQHKDSAIPEEIVDEPILDIGF